MRPLLAVLRALMMTLSATRVVRVWLEALLKGCERVGAMAVVRE